MVFEWDPRKAASNLRKHRIEFSEATTVFFDPDALTFDDPDHSNREDRQITIGTSSRLRVLFVAHAERLNAIRIISARKATRREQQQYAEATVEPN